MTKHSASVAPLPSLPVMPESLKAIAKTLAEIRDTAYLDHGKFTARYVSAEGQAAIDNWSRIRQKCSEAKEKAEKKVKYPRMTVEDGLPREFVELDELSGAAKKAYTEWDELASRLSNVFLGVGVSPLSQLAEIAWKKVAAERSAIGLIRTETDKRLEPKQREGSVVRRVRQEFYGKWYQKQQAAGQVAWDRAMIRLNGHEAKRMADRVEREAEDRQKADIRILGEQLERQLAIYLVEIGGQADGQPQK